MAAMAAPRRDKVLQDTFRAVFENGVLRPLRPIRLKERSHVLITLHRDAQRRRAFKSLLQRMKGRTKGIPQSIIEAEITRARAEVRAKRRAARRPA